MTDTIDLTAPTTVRQLVNERRDDLSDRHRDALTPTLDGLVDALGDVELSPAGAAFLSWVLRWDGTTLDGLAALVADVAGDR